MYGPSSVVLDPTFLQLVNIICKVTRRFVDFYNLSAPDQGGYYFIDDKVVRLRRLGQLHDPPIDKQRRRQIAQHSIAFIRIDARKFPLVRFLFHGMLVVIVNVTGRVQIRHALRNRFVWQIRLAIVGHHSDQI